MLNFCFYRTGRKDEVYNSSGDGNAGMYDGFSEMQTESQVLHFIHFVNTFG